MGNRLAEAIIEDPRYLLVLYSSVNMWIFQDFSTVPGLVPTRHGTIMTRGEWQELANQVEEFFDEFDDGTILDVRELAEADRAERRDGASHQPRPAIPSPGYIYLAYSETGHHKIGTSKNPDARIKQLNNTPFEVSIVHTFHANRAKTAEEVLHSHFSSKRVRGEWFILEPEDVAWLCSIQEYKDGSFLVSE